MNGTTKVDTNNETITLITKILVYLLNIYSLDVLPLVAIGYSTCRGLGNL